MQKLEGIGIEITGLGHYLPETIVTNEEIRSRLKYPEMHPAEKAVIGEIGVNKRHRASSKDTVMYWLLELLRWLSKMQVKVLRK